MIIKTFIETAVNFEEREILTKFHDGINLATQEIKSRYDQDVKNYKNSLELIDDPQARADEGKDVTVPAIPDPLLPLPDIIKNVDNQIDLGGVYSHCDVAVMVGSWKPRDRAHHILRTSIADNARCFVCIETALLGRRVFEGNTHRRIGVNGFLNNDGVFNLQDQDDGRFRQLGITWTGWKNSKNGHVLISLQLPGDASLRGINMYDWLRYVIKQIRHVTDRPIRIRTHPGHNLKDTDEFHAFITDVIVVNPVKDVSFSIGRNTPLKDDLKNAYCTVTYSSGSGIDSILYGIPTIAMDPGNFAWNVSSRYVSDIDDLYFASRDQIHQWLNNLAYSQWTTEEMHDGTAWHHLHSIISHVLSHTPIVKGKR